LHTLRVRRATRDDLDEVRELLTAAARRVRGMGIDQWPDPFPMERVSDGFQAGEVYVVRDDSRIVATQTVTDDDAFWRDRPADALYAHRLAVADGYRGLGAAVLAWTEELAASRGRSLLRIDCMASNRRLRDYYEAAGFVHAGDFEGDGWSVSRYERRVGEHR
jgi:GNAT superfamily N-acetyltransferase